MVRSGLGGPAVLTIAMPIDQADLDRWLPEPQVRTHHRRSASVAPAQLWHAAERIRVADAPRLGRVLRWRIPSTPADLPYREVFRRYPFIVLDEGEGWTVSGLCGRPWSLRRDYPELQSADEFRKWDESGTVRILFAHWVEESDNGGATLVSESRVEPVDRSASWRMRALWSALGRFEGLIGREALDAAVKAAEG
jgi:hypothetical protein